MDNEHRRLSERRKPLGKDRREEAERIRVLKIGSKMDV